MLVILLILLLIINDDLSIDDVDSTDFTVS